MKILAEKILDIIQFIILLCFILIISFLCHSFFIGHRITIGYYGLWIITFFIFIWLFLPLRLLVASEKISIFLYIKQLVIDTYILLHLLYQAISKSLILLWDLFKCLMRLISKK